MCLHDSKLSSSILSSKGRNHILLISKKKNYKKEKPCVKSISWILFASQFHMSLSETSSKKRVTIGVSYGFELIFIHTYAYSNHTHKRTQFMAYAIQKCSLYKAYDCILASKNEAKTELSVYFPFTRSKLFLVAIVTADRLAFFCHYYNLKRK